MIDPDQYDGFATPEELNLTPEEIEELRQNKRYLTAYAQQKLRKLRCPIIHSYTQRPDD
jgi:hypothetical protein